MRADQLLVERGLATTRSQAQRLIASGVRAVLAVPIVPLLIGAVFVIRTARDERTAREKVTQTFAVKAQVEEEFAAVRGGVLTLPQAELDRITAYFAPPAFKTVPAAVIDTTMGRPSGRNPIPDGRVARLAITSVLPCRSTVMT